MLKIETADDFTALGERFITVHIGALVGVAVIASFLYQRFFD